MLRKYLTKMFGRASDPNAPIISGKVRPPNVPANWTGSPLPENQGWAWTNPENHGDCVRIYSAEEPYVIVTSDGMLIGPDGKPTGERLDD